jgi:predicted adenylyl cyclase CyaB
MTALRRNLELKARCPDLNRARAAVVQLGAPPAGQEIQTDTFFPVRKGRLKLREIDGQPAVLIWYDRPDQTGARLSNYHLVPIADAELLKTTLTAALGVIGQVHKQRDIYLWHNVRIHLDEVEGLGSFVEFEAVLGPEDDLQTAHERLTDLSARLGIAPADRLSHAYADLLGLGKPPAAP